MLESFQLELGQSDPISVWVDDIEVVGVEEVSFFIN